MRGDSHWNVPEPELSVVLNPEMEIVGFTAGNDVSSRDIEGENPLYLPQAKVYRHSCILGPAITLADETVDGTGLDIDLQICRAGQVIFEGATNTSQMNRTLDELADYLGRYHDFPYGAVLMTGTPIVPGDEFTLLLYNIDKRDVMNVAENFRALCDDYKFVEDDTTCNIACSIGVTMIDRQVKSAEDALSHADLACNMAKQQGRNRAKLYNPADSDKAGMAADMGWAARVREMLEHDRFKLVYQPIVSTSDGHVLDYEVLVRMISEDGKVILPGGFMPAAERFGLIHSVDRWIVSRAIQHLASLRAAGHPANFSINLSGKAFEDATLLPLIQELLDSSGLDPTWVTFEITETAAIANLTAAEDFITALKDIGCQFALDDFGSGFSSFAYLKHLPVDKLKIDGAFVKGMAHSSVDQAMVESMNQVAHALGKQTVAECVENEATLLILREMGIDRAQGNYIGRPAAVPVNTIRHTAPAEITAHPH